MGVKNKTMTLKVDNPKRKQGRVNKIWTRKNSLAANLFRVDKAITIFQNATNNINKVRATRFKTSLHISRVDCIQSLTYKFLL